LLRTFSHGKISFLRFKPVEKRTATTGKQKGGILMSEDYRRIEPRVKNVEEAIQLLTELTLRADERMDNFDAALSNLVAKVEALTDAQIRTEESLTRLAEAQAHTDQRLDALIDIVRGFNQQ
jgi:ABC-type transporter Mla subunit MlaD